MEIDVRSCHCDVTKPYETELAVLSAPSASVGSSGFWICFSLFGYVYHPLPPALSRSLSLSLFLSLSLSPCPPQETACGQRESSIQTPNPLRTQIPSPLSDAQFSAAVAGTTLSSRGALMYRLRSIALPRNNSQVCILRAKTQICALNPQP